MVTVQRVDELMRAFGKGILRGDLEILRSAVTDDFEWHFAAGPDDPNGKIYRGAKGALEGKKENAQIYKDLFFHDIEYYPAGDDKMVMTARVTGIFVPTGKPFNLRTIELYTVRDDRIARKDVFWKQSTD